MNTSNTMNVALKCFNRLYIKPNTLKDTFTWIYVFPNEINPHYYNNYLAKCKNPKSLEDCLHLRTVHLTEKEIEKWFSILTYTINVGSYHCEHPTNHLEHKHLQYMIRDYSIKLE